MKNQKQKPVFVGYSHKDLKIKELLLTMIASAGAGASPSAWDDSQLRGGDLWNQEIQKQLTSCGSAILLISPDFLVSNYITMTEVPALLRRRSNSGLRLFPILVRPCLWQHHSWLADTQMYCATKPLMHHNRISSREEVLKNFVSEVLRSHSIRS